MSSLRVILGDQLSEQISSLIDCDKQHDMILLAEVWQEASYVKHHQKKIVLLFSAMRHFAQKLDEQGYNIIYRQLDDPDNTQNLSSEVMRVIQQYPNKFTQIIITHPGEYRVLTDINHWSKLTKLPVIIRDDSRFLCSLEQFKQWAGTRKQVRMEFFYRELRKQYQILVTGPNNDQPVGGTWNYDSQNRKPANHKLDIPEPFINPPDAITKAVIELVKEKFASHFGDIEPFTLAVTRKQALAVLKQFIAERLNYFGDYQDAMLENQPWMFHAHISSYLNCGLLNPLECIQAAEQAYHQQQAPLNCVEGFIRQVLGWREFVRGIYWLKMPDYAAVNFLNATRNLPKFYWTAKTELNCLKQAVLETKKNAYAHHIQRLMVLGNFALLAGVDPAQVNEWFLIVYSDAYEWVELPNVTGMALFADGGYLASKPYAAGGSYIHKMSNYCKNCCYKVSQKAGPDACPFNYLYWDFLARNQTKLANNQRMSMMYKVYQKMSAEKKAQIKHDSEHFLAGLDAE